MIFEVLVLSQSGLDNVLVSVGSVLAQHYETSARLCRDAVCFAIISCVASIACRRGAAPSATAAAVSCPSVSGAHGFNGAQTDYLRLLQRCRNVKSGEPAECRPNHTRQGRATVEFCHFSISPDSLTSSNREFQPVSHRRSGKRDG